jgi:hypothetical protein
VPAGTAARLTIAGSLGERGDRGAFDGDRPGGRQGSPAPGVMLATGAAAAIERPRGGVTTRPSTGQASVAGRE